VTTTIASPAADRSAVGWRSALYEGVVRHRRFAPTAHEFHYGVVMTLLDVDEADGPDSPIDSLPLWSTRRWAPVRYRRTDYLDGGDRPLRDALGDVVEREIHRRPTGRIRMLTHLRTWGWLFNPITVYWCDAADGTPDIVVLEVTNTPWGERAWYVVEAEYVSGRGAVFPKALHVSPFLAMDLDYRFSFTTPTAAANSPLTIRLEVLEHGHKVFDADLSLRRTELTSRSAVGVLLRHPTQTMRISAGIHWQALRLWAKRVPVVPHPRSHRQIRGGPS
jgi:DUF1365 family protein